MQMLNGLRHPVPPDSTVLDIAIFTIFGAGPFVFRYLFVPLILPPTGLISQANVTVRCSMRQVISYLSLEKSNVPSSH